MFIANFQPLLLPLKLNCDYPRTSYRNGHEGLLSFLKLLRYCRYPNAIVISFEGLWKLCIFIKFGGCSSKIEPATPISILSFWRAWQPYFLCHTLQILFNYVYFKDRQMIFYKDSCISDRIPTIFKNQVFFLWQWPPSIQKSDFCILGGHCQRKKISFLKIVGILSEIQKFL